MKVKNGSKRFVTEYAGLFCMEPVIVLTTFGVSALYNIPTEYMIYLIALNIAVWLMVLCIQYRFFKKKNEEYQEEIRNLQRNHREENQKWENLREKQDFFALWAHQIKTPIAAMHLLLQSEETDTADCRQELFKIENYVEMALNYLRFEEMSNDLVLERNSLEALVRQTVKKYAFVFIHNHIAIKLGDLDYRVLTDEKWFCFVLEQILSNALKYTRQGSVTIFAEKEDEGIRLTIRDTGIGIRSEDLPRIFEKGFTGYNGRMDKKASGLGLYLCKGICEKLGHRIEVFSTEGKGTDMCITMPQENVKWKDLTEM